jgi:hypothetical protein
MRLVLANNSLVAPGGTEVYLVTVGEHLQRLGHDVVLYAGEVGAFADHARRRGLVVEDTVRGLPDDADVVLAQDAVVAYDLAQRYPDALNVFRLCSDVYDFSLPPHVSAIVDLVVVLSERYERLARAVAVQAPVLRLKVPVDVDRLAPLGPTRERPESVVLLGNYPEREALIRDVWGEAGLDVRRVGGDAYTYDVATALADADIVVAKSRAVVDAMSCGRAVYVFDLWGGDGWVTPELYPALEADNFAGLATDRVIDRRALAADLAGYRQEMGAVNRDLVLQHHNARDHVVELVRAFHDRVPQPRPRAPLQELARLTALQWSTEETARYVRYMLWLLRTRTTQTEAALAELSQAAHEARVERDHARLELDEVRREWDEALRAVAAARVERQEAVEEQAAMRATRAWRVAEVMRRARLRATGRAVGGEERVDGALPPDSAPLEDRPLPATSD